VPLKHEYANYICIGSLNKQLGTPSKDRKAGLKEYTSIITYLDGCMYFILIIACCRVESAVLLFFINLVKGENCGWVRGS
jgi:hypothetical protein